MSILSANLTTTKNEVFYSDSLATLITYSSTEVMYQNNNVTPPNYPQNALVTSSKLEVMYTGIISSNLTVVKAEVLRSVAVRHTTALLTTVKKETLYTIHPTINLTSVKKEVIYQNKNAQATGNLTTVKNEVLYTGQVTIDLTATKLEVLRSLATGPFGTVRRLLVLWNPEGLGK